MPVPRSCNRFSSHRSLARSVAEPTGSIGGCVSVIRRTQQGPSSAECAPRPVAPRPPRAPRRPAQARGGRPIGARPAWSSGPAPRRPADRRYQLIGAGGLAVISMVLPDPDIVAVRIGPNIPQPPNSGTVTFVLKENPPTTRAFTCSEMLSGSWIGSTVVQPSGTVRSPTPTEPTSSFAEPLALSLKTPLLVRPTLPWIVPVGVRAPFTVTGISPIQIVWSIGGIDRVAVRAPEVTSPSAVNVEPLGTSTEIPLFASVTLPLSSHPGRGTIRSPVSGVRRADDGNVAPAACSPHVLGALLPASRSSIHLITLAIAVGSLSR